MIFGSNCEKFKLIGKFLIKYSFKNRCILFLLGCSAKSILNSLPMTTSQTTKGKQNKTSIVVKSKKQLMQILDTTLLKCYLKINDSLVASLLRLKNNFCHQEETERALKKCQKYPELIIFYNTKGAHKKGM